MAALIYLDTHVALWLYGGRIDLLPAGVRNLLEQNDLLISPMVFLEMQYLFELRRTSEPAATVLAALSREIGLGVCDLSFFEVAQEALRQDWTRDPFDRLITGQAVVRGAPLLTRDQDIRDHYSQAVWSE
jgi:PIN domain nuclease of toxin-antitoxin system